MAAFGPGMILLFLFQPKGFHYPPLPIMLLLFAFLIVPVTVLFPIRLWKVLFRNRRVEVSMAGINLMAGKKTHETVNVRAIQEIAIENIPYSIEVGTSWKEHPNFVLTAKLTDGTKKNLCLADNENQIKQLQVSVKARLGLAGNSFA